MLSIDQWCICENGAYLYHPQTDELVYHPLITDRTLQALDDFQQKLRQKEYRSLYVKEPGKEVCISLNPVSMAIEALYERVADIIDDDLLYINHSTTAVYITPKGVNKGSALVFLAEREDMKLEDIVAIGDSSGDLPFMTLSVLVPT